MGNPVAVFGAAKACPAADFTPDGGDEAIDVTLWVTTQSYNRAHPFNGSEGSKLNHSIQTQEYERDTLNI